MGALRGRVDLEFLNEQEGVEAVDECDYKALTAEGRERAREIIESDYAEAFANAE